MSGDQEPWVFRGGLTADLQVGRQLCMRASERGTGGGSVRARERARHTLRGTVNSIHSSLDTTDVILQRYDYRISNIKTTELIKSLLHSHSECLASSYLMLLNSCTSDAIE